MTNGIIGAYSLTFTALNAFLLINYGFAVHHSNGAFGTDALTRMGNTAHAGTGDLIFILRTGITGRRNHLHQRRFIIFLIDVAFFQPLCQMSRTLSVLRPETHSHGKTDTLPDNSPVTVNALKKLSLFIVYNLIGKRFHIILKTGGMICQIGHFLKHFPAFLSDRSVNSSHTHIKHHTFP